EHAAAERFLHFSVKLNLLFGSDQGLLTVGRRGPRARAARSKGSDRLDVDRLRAFLSLAGLVLDLRVLGQRLEAGADDVRVVHEQVLTALVRGDEPISLRVVEPLHGSGSHETPPLTLHERVEEAAPPVLVLGFATMSVAIPEAARSDT